ncbi:MAG: sulfatase-like hydrolase/transferase [Planctomycetota bacterium]
MRRHDAVVERRLNRSVAGREGTSAGAMITRAAFVVVALLSVGVVHPAAAAERDSRPNIVLVFADDLGVNDLGCYGRAEHRTPNLDRLASQGARFTTAYTAQPICSPSRAALMTGKCPARLNLTNFLPGRPDTTTQKLLQPRIEGFLPLEEVTLAELLRQSGYATGLFGKWHLGGPNHSPQQQGFDVVESPPANTKPQTRGEKRGNGESNDSVPAKNETPDAGLLEGGKGEFAITAAAEKFITDNKDRPFFCYVPHNNPHIPLAASTDLIEKNRDAFHPTYAAMIETLDQSIGRLTAKLDQLGLTERTIFIFTSDNGGLHVLEFPGTPATHNRPYRAGKGYLYEGGLREPLIVRWPGVAAAGRVTDTPVVLTDLVPTLLEAAGIDAAKTVGPLDGVSLVKLLRGGELPARPLFWHFPNYTNQGGRPAGAIRDGDWKLVEQFEDGSLELYNLAADVGETRNLAADEPQRVEKMAAALRAWRLRVGARMPTPNPDFDAAAHRALYIDQDPSRLAPAKTAAATEPEWKAWRTAMNDAAKGRKPRVTPAQGDIRLHAKDARVHAETMRYEPQPNKNVLGFWVKQTDWADWEFTVDKPGRYEVEIQQGCGAGSGGAEVAIEVGGQTLMFTVQDTGHFQHMILKVVGTVELPAGRHTLAVKPRTKPGVAVMDVRRVVLRPTE